MRDLVRDDVLGTVRGWCGVDVMMRAGRVVYLLRLNSVFAV